ncbi:MAG: hypothetical protein GWP08_21535 [Nitrospiraceae bacterium]|nr:hypothetical protein [Nitrospiraceae bacterium]
MMESSLEITKLCESWWGRVADSSKADQRQFAEQLLELLGWHDTAPAEPRPVLTQLGAVAYILRGDGQTAVAAYFVMPGSLEPPTPVIQRGLDYCETTRWLVNETRATHLDYAFITDLHRSYLYDARTDELLLHANSPDDFKRDFVDILTRADVERGALEEVRRQPRSYAARQLREWCHHWCETFMAGAAGRPQAVLTEDVALLAIDRLLVLRYLFDHDILKRTGWRLRKRFADLAAKAFRADPRGCGKQLTAMFHDIWFDWKADLFAANPALDAVLERDEVAVPLLKEFSLHSRTKFSIATILESFNYGEAAEKARVRMVPEIDEDREVYLSKQTTATIDSVHIEIDLEDEGYRAVFFWFDKLVALYERLEVEFDAKMFRGTPPEQEMDLFAWSEIAAKRPQALADKFQHVIEHGLTMYYSSSRQLRIARLMLYLHLVSRYDLTKQRFLQFPPMQAVFKPRPRVLESDRKQIFQPQTKNDNEWYL